MRPRSPPCVPTCMLVPQTMSSTSEVSSALRSAIAASTVAPSCCGWSSARAPFPTLPIPRGVRQASMIQASVTGTSRRSVVGMSVGASPHKHAPGSENSILFTDWSATPLGGWIVTQPFAGVRVLEVASWTFVPAAGAALADLGADVIKVEPPNGDPQRGLMNLLARGGRCRSQSVRRDSEPRQAQHHARSCEHCRTRSAARARRHIRRLLDELPPRRPPEAEDRSRRHPPGQPAHHLRTRLGLGRARTDGKHRRLRPRRGLGVILDGLQDDEAGIRADVSARRLLRSSRREHDCRGDRRRVVPPGTYRRGNRDRRVVVGRRHVGAQPRHHGRARRRLTAIAAPGRGPESDRQLVPDRR